MGISAAAILLRLTKSSVRNGRRCLQTNPLLPIQGMFRTNINFPVGALGRKVGGFLRCVLLDSTVWGYIRHIRQKNPSFSFPRPWGIITYTALGRKCGNIDAESSRTDGYTGTPTIWRNAQWASFQMMGPDTTIDGSF